MEQATKKTEGVADATVNFMTQKMIVEFAEGADPKDEYGLAAVRPVITT